MSKLTDSLFVVIDSYEQALAFLDADSTTEDEHIQALFTVKVCAAVRFSRTAADSV